MKRRYAIILLIVLLVLSLVSCKSKNDKDLVKEEVEDKVEVDKIQKLEAHIIEIDLDGKNILVKGLGKNNILGDKSYIDISDAKIEDIDAKTLSEEDLSVGDKIELEVGQVEESYPSQTKTKFIRIVEKVKEESEEEKIVKHEEQAKEVETPVERLVKISRIYEEPDKNTYNYIYQDKDMSGEYTILEAHNIGLDRVQVFSLIYENDNLEEDELLYEIRGVKHGEKVFFDSYYPEGIPSRKIKWISDDGKIDEWILQYDGRGDRPDTIEFKY